MSNKERSRGQSASRAENNARPAQHERKTKRYCVVRLEEVKEEVCLDVKAVKMRIMGIHRGKYV